MQFFLTLHMYYTIYLNYNILLRYRGAVAQSV